VLAGKTGPHGKRTSARIPLSFASACAILSVSTRIYTRTRNRIELCLTALEKRIVSALCTVPCFRDSFPLGFGLCTRIEEKLSAEYLPER
jgi:hypothetical protein